MILPSSGFHSLSEGPSRFWKQIRVDFPIMCLHPAQPLEVIRRMASVLCTSVVSDSFGPVTSAQHKHGAFLLEAATKPLEMVPRQPSKDKKYTPVQILELRQTLVQFLGSVCSIEPGMLALAKHERAVLRLAIRIAEEVDQCYEWRLGEGIRCVRFRSPYPLRPRILTVVQNRFHQLRSPPPPRHNHQPPRRSKREISHEP